MKEFYQVKKKYLADALSFLGFRYYKFNDNGTIVYTFEKSEKFRQALKELFDLKSKLN